VDDLKPELIKEFAPELPQFNWIIFARDHIFHIEENPENQSEKPEDRQVAMPAPPHFDEALQKLNVAIHTDWEWVKFHTKLQLRALEWEKHKDASRLLRGRELREAEGWLAQVGTSKDPQPTILQRQYALASRRAEATRQTTTLAASLIALAIVIVLGILALRAQQSARSEANARATAESNAVGASHASATAQAVAEAQRQVAVEQSSIALSRQLAAQAINQIQNKDISLGLLLSLEAYRHADTMDARSSLLRLILTEPELRYFIYGHTGRIWSVAISPDGKTIASASEDTSIGLWDAASGEAAHAPLMGHTGGVAAVAYSPDGGSLVSGGMDGQVILWDASQAYASRTLFSKSNMWVYKLAFSPDGKYLAASFTDESVVIWNMLDQSMACPSINGQSDNQAFTVLALSPDGKNLAVGNDNGALSFWNPDTCQQQGDTLDVAKLAKLTGTGQTGEVTSLAYSPDGKQLSIGEADYLLVLDTSSYTPIRDTIPIHTNYRIESIAYSPDGSSVALGMDDNSIVRLDAASGKAIGQPLVGQGGAVRSVAFSPDGQTLVSGAWDASVAVWGLQNQPLSRTLPVKATEVAFSPNGKVLASAFGSIAQVSLWDTTSWQGVGQPLTGSQGEVDALAFSPDSRILAAGGGDKLVHLWDISQGMPADTPLDGQGDIINCLAFSPDGKWLAAGGANNTWTIWKMADRSLYQHGQITPPFSNDPYGFDLSKSIRSVGFSPDSATFYLSMGGGLHVFCKYGRFCIW
jgi:WD40 repeat protein